MTLNISKSAIVAWARFLRSQQVAMGGVEADLKAAGFPPSVWYDILLELERAENGNLRQVDIYQRMLLERYEISRIVVRMTKAGLVQPTSYASDGRGAGAQITAKGRRIREAMWQAYATAIERNFSRHFDEEELQSLAGYLGRFLDID